MISHLPYGAAQIIALRQSGKRPADPVLVSLVGPLNGETNPMVIASPARHYDWRFLTYLDVILVCESAAQHQPTVRAIIEQIKALPVVSLAVWLADRQNGLCVVAGGVQAKPRGLLRYLSKEDRAAYAGLGLRKESKQCA